MSELLKSKTVSVSLFIPSVEIVKENYNDYKLECESSNLNEHLCSIGDIKDLEKIQYLPYLNKYYKLEKFEKHLKTLIESNKGDLENATILYNKLKEITEDNKPIKENPLNDPDIYSLFTSSSKDNSLYYDLIAMRIAKYKTFSSSYVTYFEEILNSNDEDITKKVADVIEYYPNVLFSVPAPLWRGLWHIASNRLSAYASSFLIFIACRVLNKIPASPLYIRLRKS